MNKSPGKASKPRSKQLSTSSPSGLAVKCSGGTPEILPGKPTAGNTASPPPRAAALLRLHWCGAPASQSDQCNWPLRCPSLLFLTSIVRAVIQHRPYRHVSARPCALWQRLSVCLRIFPGRSGLRRAGAGLWYP